MYSHIWMPLKSTVPSARAIFLEINTTDKSLALSLAFSQNGIKLQTRFFSEIKCFLGDGNQTRTLAA